LGFRWFRQAYHGHGFHPTNPKITKTTGKNGTIGQIINFKLPKIMIARFVMIPIIMMIVLIIAPINLDTVLSIKALNITSIEPCTLPADICLKGENKLLTSTGIEK
jgi:hypothetical protein